MASSSLPKGLKTSIKFTPQAVDDTFTFDEDAGAGDMSTADLLANDGGGNAARVWGLYHQSESFVQANAGSLLSNSTPNGSTSFVSGGVTIAYDAVNGGVDISFDPADFQHLGEGERTIACTFTYVIRMANGAFSTATATIEITGSNDGPTINAFTDGAVSEDDSTPTLNADGTVTFDDLDTNDTHTLTSVTASSGNGLGGAMTAAISDTATGAGDGTISWSYSVDNEATQYLAAGETATETFTIAVEDNHGAAVSQEISVVVTGVNDDVEIDEDTTIADGVVTEDGADPLLTASGIVTFNDRDLSDSHTASATKDSGNLGGTLSLSAVAEAANAATGSVEWTYETDNAAVQSLGEGETATESFTVSIDDGNGSAAAQTVSVTITGVNDGPEIALSGADSDASNLVETNSGLAASGTLTVTDVDTTDVVTATVAGISTSGPTGGLTEAELMSFFNVSPDSLAADSDDANNLSWSFDSNGEAFDFLSEGDTLTLSYSIDAIDDSGAANDTASHIVTVTITGSADADTNTANDYDLLDVNGNLQVTSTGLNPGGNTHLFNGSNGADVIVTTNDALNGDTVNGQNGGDTIYGRGGNDTLRGNNQSDTIYGGSGDDVLTGGNAADVLWGGSGNDTFAFNGTGDSTLAASDRIQDFHHSFDKIDLQAVFAGVLGYSGVTAAANSVWFTESGGDTILNVDTNGSAATIEMRILLTGTGLGLAAGDFLL